MTPENVAMAIELALYRVSDRMKKRDAYSIDVANGIREVGEEFAAIMSAVAKAVSEQRA